MFSTTIADHQYHPGLTADDAEAGLEAVAAALQPELVVHLGVDVLQRGQGGAPRVAVVPAHQRQPAHEQVLTNLQSYVVIYLP